MVKRQNRFLRRPWNPRQGETADARSNWIGRVAKYDIDFRSAIAVCRGREEIRQPWAMGKGFLDIWIRYVCGGCSNGALSGCWPENFPYCPDHWDRLRPGAFGDCTAHKIPVRALALPAMPCSMAWEEAQEGIQLCDVRPEAASDEAISGTFQCFMRHSCRSCEMRSNFSTCAHKSC